MPGGGAPIAGVVAGVDPQVDATTRLASVFARLGAGSRVGPGEALSTTLAVGAGTTAGVVVPYAALLDDGGRSYVFVVKGDVAKSRDVVPGNSTGDSIVIARGVAAGERVVVKRRHRADRRHEGPGRRPVNEAQSAATPLPPLRRHARSIWLLVALVTLAGLLAASKLPVTLFPHIDYPRVVVSIDAGDRDIAQMAASVTRPAEIALRQIPGVTQIRSTTSRGTAEVSLTFAWGDDMVAATLATQGALATILPDLPPGTRFSVRRSDPTIFPVYGLSLTSDQRSGVELQRLARLRLRPLLSTVPGVAGVDVLGGGTPEIEVEADPARLAAIGLTSADLATALAASNSVAAVGRIEDRHRLYLTLVEDRVVTEADIAAVPVKAGTTGGAGVVTLGQVATVRRAAAPVYTRVTANGTDAVLINVRQTPTADAIALVAAIQAKLRGGGPAGGRQGQPVLRPVRAGQRRRDVGARRDPARRGARRAWSCSLSFAAGG